MNLHQKKNPPRDFLIDLSSYNTMIAINDRLSMNQLVKDILYLILLVLAVASTLTAYIVDAVYLQKHHLNNLGLQC